MKRSYKEEYQYWLDSPALGEEEWKELSSIAEDEKEIESRFFAPLEFGTAGLRGVMATGLNRMNIHVIRWATQAFATVVKAEGEEACKKGVVICYDCRLNSEKFAREAAGVMAANGIRVRIFDALRPTPELSFAVIHYGATAGINITASHNPREYNGYKVYWSDGAQLPPQHAAAVAEEMSKIDIFHDVKRQSFDEAMASGLVEVIGAETDEAFLENVMAMSINKAVVEKVADEFKIVYTPFHGAGYKLVPEALKRLGVKHLYAEPKQMVIDGNFPTVVSPNPENPEGFYLAVDLAKQVGSDLIIGTDPDSDRVGTMVRGKDGEYRTITGNQMGVLLLDYICNTLYPDKVAAGEPVKVLKVWVGPNFNSPFDRRQVGYEKYEQEGLIQTVETIGPSDFNNAEASMTDVTTATLAKYQPGDIDAIWCCYDLYASGVYTALTQGNFDIPMVSVDISNADIDKMAAANSPWKACATTNWYYNGEFGMRVLALEMAGEYDKIIDPMTGTASDWLELPTTVVTQDMVSGGGINVMNLDTVAGEGYSDRSWMPTTDWMAALLGD